MQIDYLALAEGLGIRGSRTMTGELYARCPLHDDRSPSFSLNLSTGLWFCHAEQRGGNFEQLVMELHDVRYREAVRWIYNTSPFISGTEPEIDAIQEEDVLEKEMALYNILPERSMAKYWIQRGYPLSHAHRWGVRYSVITRQLWIPYRWPFNGPIIGFIRRSIDPDHRPKYRNTPGLPRNEYLFGYGAIDFQTITSPLLLTEGPFDVLRADLHEFPAAAILGTYMSARQALQLVRCRRDIILAFDQGEEGEQATRFASTLLREYGILTRVFTYPASVGEGELDLGNLTRQEMLAGVHNAKVPFLI